MNVRPINDRILVRRLDTKSESKGLVIPEVCQERSTRGLVIAVGPGKRGKKGERIPCDVKPGDIVLFGKYTDFDRDNLVMIQEADVRYIESAA